MVLDKITSEDIYYIRVKKLITDVTRYSLDLLITGLTASPTTSPTTSPTISPTIT